MAWGIFIWAARGWDGVGWTRMGVRIHFQALLGHIGPRGVSSGTIFRIFGFFWGVPLASPGSVLFPYSPGVVCGLLSSLWLQEHHRSSSSSRAGSKQSPMGCDKGEPLTILKNRQPQGNNPGGGTPNIPK